MSEEEIKQAEVKDDINELLPKEEVIEKPTKDSSPYEEVIENARLRFMAKYKVGRRNSYIAMGVFLVLAILSVVFITLQPMGFKIAGWAIIGSTIVGLLVYYIVTKNSLPNATQEYIKVVNEELNKRNFADTRYSEVTTDKSERLELSEPLSDSIFTGINQIASRNVINGKFDGRTFKVCDMGLYGGAGRNRTSAFVGKYVSYPNDLNFEQRYIITFKGETPVDLPSDVSDLTVLEEKDNMIVYGKEGAKYESDLGKAFLKKIKELIVEKHLLNVSLVIWGGHSSAYASYDDSIMTLPFQNEFNNESNEQYAKNLYLILDAFKELVKEEK